MTLILDFAMEPDWVYFILRTSIVLVSEMLNIGPFKLTESLRQLHQPDEKENGT